MVWQWSHTSDALDDLRANIATLDETTRKVVIAEIATYRHAKDVAIACANAQGEEVGDEEWFDNAFYEAFMESDRLQAILNGNWAEYIWEFAEEQSLCGKGGIHAWICPYGCHTLPFDPLPEAIPDRVIEQLLEQYGDRDLDADNARAILQDHPAGSRNRRRGKTG